MVSSGATSTHAHNTILNCSFHCLLKFGNLRITNFLKLELICMDLNHRNHSPKFIVLGVFKSNIRSLKYLSIYRYIGICIDIYIK